MSAPATLHVGIAGIGLLGPGLADWTSGQVHLRQPAGWAPTPTVVPPPLRLPPTERRRAGTVVKASVVVADEACAMAGMDPSTLATVFTSSTGDPVNCHALCESLAGADRVVSPTRFTNSVHNASAGYWHIAVKSTRPSTSLASFDASLAAGLLEAASQCVDSQQPVLMVACDLPYPEPLNTLRPVADVLAVALLLVPASQAHVAQLELKLCSTAEPGCTPTRCDDQRLEHLRQHIPAGCALPLLQALAGAAPSANGTVVIAGPSGLALQLHWSGLPTQAAP